MWIALLVLGGVLIGGVVSFARNREWPAMVACSAAALLALAGAYGWMPR